MSPMMQSLCMKPRSLSCITLLNPWRRREWTRFEP
jgi:hypothetical protein